MAIKLDKTLHFVNMHFLIQTEIKSIEIEGSFKRKYQETNNYYTDLNKVD